MRGRTVLAVASAALAARVASVAVAPPGAPTLPAATAPLAGDLFYATCNLPQCSTLALALYNLANASGSIVYDFPFDEFEDGYVADSLLINGTELVLSLQYDGAPQQGFVASFDLASRTWLGGFNASFCFSLWLDPADSDRLLCLALEPNCDGGSQCTQLRHLSRANHTDTLVASFLPNFAPYTVSCLDTARGLIYSTFGPLTSGHNVFAAIHPLTGAVVSIVTFPISTAYIELEYDAVTDRVYAVVEDATNGAFFGTVEPSTGAATPVSDKARFNTTTWNQFNTISTVAPEIGVFFFTAFHYAIPGPPPSDPVLHLLGTSLATGEIVYDEIVANPFCEILWLPVPRSPTGGAGKRPAVA